MSVTNLGDDRWFNYSVQIEGRFDQSDLSEKNYIGIGGRYNLPDSGKNGIWLKLQANGKWDLMRNSLSVKKGNIKAFSKDDKWQKEWHKLSLSFEGMTISAFIDDVKVCDFELGLGEKVSLQGAGRAAIYSAYRKNCYKNLKITPLGKKYYITRFDNLDSVFTYDDKTPWEHSLMDSFKCYKRTVSKAQKGSSFTLTFSGSAFILTGNSEKGAGIKVTLDGKEYEIIKVGKTGNREALYYSGDLKEGKHKAEITILAGSLNLDGAEIK